MMAQERFAQLLTQARQAAGLSRGALAQRVGLDTSHLYRLETGARRPSRESALALAEALGVDGDAVNRWVSAAGYVPMPLLSRVRGAVRTRGRGPSPHTITDPSPDWDTARWARWLEAMGLQERTIGQLLQAMETVDLPERQGVIAAVSRTFAHLLARLEAPVRTVVIPAAGGQHRLLAQSVMQRLLLRAIREAVKAGIAHIVLVLAPGMTEQLYTPLQAALELAIVPSITLCCCEQVQPQGLGDALLQAEPLLGKAPFAVLLPDDIVRERAGRTVHPQELRRMMEAFRQLRSPCLVAITPIPKAKMPHCGVAQVALDESTPGIRPLVRLIEKPLATDPICDAPQAVGIVGRYLLSADVFGPLHALRTRGHQPLHLTEALEHLRQGGYGVYGFELAAARHDVGEILGQAGALVGEASKLLE